MPIFKQDFIASPKDIYSTCQQPAANMQKMYKNNYLPTTFNDKRNRLTTIVNKPLANFLWGKHHLEKKNEIIIISKFLAQDNDFPAFWLVP